jgi:hypothetical protein
MLKFRDLVLSSLLLGTICTQLLAQDRIPGFMGVSWGSQPDQLESQWGTADARDTSGPYFTLSYMDLPLWGAEGVAFGFQFDDSDGLVRGFCLFIGPAADGPPAAAAWMAGMVGVYGEPIHECSSEEACSEGFEDGFIYRAVWNGTESSAYLHLKYLEPRRAWLTLSFEHALFEPPAQD